MDKYDVVLDIIGHPENYSDDDLKTLLADAETRELYNLLCETASCVKMSETLTPDDVDEEWKKFESKHYGHRFKFMWLSGRAAMIAVVILTSLVAVAVGIVVRFAVSDKTTDVTMARAETVSNNATTACVTDTVKTALTLSVPAEPLVFEDATLSEIVAAIAKAYNVTAYYKDATVKDLHLYYRFDAGKSLSEIVEQLNTFEQINIVVDGDKLIVE